MMDFKLSDEFVDSYRDKEVPWGYADGVGNALGEITFLRTYSRKKEDGTKETWVDTCRRVVEGMFTIQKRHCRKNHIEWKNDKAQRTAKDAFDRLFHMKWLPAGRGLWAMGTPLVMEKGNSAPLQNCAFTTTEESVVDAMTFLFDASMLGIGVGFDARGAGKFQVSQPEGEPEKWVIPDSREGWVESLKTLMNSFIDEGRKRNPLPIFDYSEIRPEGAEIKTFGGTASGPEPLKKIHVTIQGILEKRIGSRLSMVDIADIGNLIGTAVVAGSTRRSAEIFFVDRESDDLEDFLNLKNFDAMPERAAWSWMSNNSITAKVGDDLSPLMEGIKLNGEPGIVWPDVAKNYGRIKDGVNTKDSRIIATNPCMTADSKLLTDKGWITFGEAYLSGAPQNIVVDGRISYAPSEDGLEHPENWRRDKSVSYSPQTMQASHVFKTQENADIVKVTTTTGLEVRTTPDHLFATQRGMIAAEDLIPNEDRVLVTRGYYPSEELGLPKTREEIDAVLMGLIAGDGTFASGKDTERAFIDLWGEDREITEQVSLWIQDLFDEYSHIYTSNSNRPFTPYTVLEQSDRNKVRIQSSFLAAYLNGEYGFSKNTKHTVPEVFLQQASSRPARFYVAALAFCDGTVNSYAKTGSSSIRIAQANKKMLQDVQLICLANGIQSSLYSRKPSGYHMLPDGRGGNEEYLCKEAFELIFMGNAYEYNKYIGFLWGHKIERALDIITPSRKQNAYATVLSVVPDGVEDVYCLKEDERRILCANGFTVRRCGEIFLEDKELCNLVELFLPNVDDHEDYIKTLKVAYLYGKTVTLLPTKWEATNTVMQRNRRIGLSISGVADYADRHGMAHLRQEFDDGYDYLAKLDTKYSEWLCIRESIRRTTQKPSGSVSILAGTSPGTHWTPGGEFFIRRITFSKSNPLFAELVEAGYEYETLDHDPTNAVILFPIHSKSKRSSSDVPAWEKIHLAAEVQAWWADNGVSCTVDFKPEEAEHIPTLLSMYDGKLKGISFLPAIEGGAYKHMPYEQITQEKFEEMSSKVNKIDFSVAYSEKAEEAEGEKYCSTDVCEIKEELADDGDLVVVPMIDLLKK